MTAAVALIALGMGAAVLAPRLAARPLASRPSPWPSSTSSSSPTVSATPRAPGVPARLVVPSIGVDASIEQVGLAANGDMDTPRDPSDVAWYSPGVRPGMPGDAVVAGHLDTATGPAVFADLGALRVGAVVTIVDAAGASRRFTVSRVATYAVDDEPAYLFAAAGAPTLTLITCAGSWDGAQYTQRLVVDAVPA